MHSNRHEIPSDDLLEALLESESRTTDMPKDELIQELAEEAVSSRSLEAAYSTQSPISRNTTKPETAKRKRKMRSNRTHRITVEEAAFRDNRHLITEADR